MTSVSARFASPDEAGLTDGRIGDVGNNHDTYETSGTTIERESSNVVGYAGGTVRARFITDRETR